jgi:diguanylate cyclase (GGDEF)-like protein
VGDPPVVDTTPDAPEQARVRVLHELDLLDQPRTPELEALARLTAYICGTPTAVVNLIDVDRQWQAAAFGVEPGEVTREDSMCAQVFRSGSVTYTADASRDPLFSGNPFVTGRIANVRLYASAPLVVSDQPMGTLCAFAEDSHELTGEQLARLEDLALAAARFLELRRVTAQLARTATRDELTGLYSRAVLHEALERALARRARSLTEPGLIYLDLDGFKPVNDVHGHGAGDLVLREVARRLEGAVRATDVVIRLGGDEFVVLVEEPPSLEAAETSVARVARRIREVVAEPIRLDDGTLVTVTTSVGCAIARDQESVADLLHRADRAMYADKGASAAGR